MTSSPEIGPTGINPNEEKKPLSPHHRLSQPRGAYRVYQQLDQLAESIARRGEAVPGDLHKEFGWPRSSLSYNLGRAIKKGMIVRIGGGRSIRYRITTPEEREAHRKAKWAKELERRAAKTAPPALRPQVEGQALGVPVPGTSLRSPTQDRPTALPPQTPAPTKEQHEKGILSSVLKGFFKKVLKR